MTADVQLNSFWDEKEENSFKPYTPECKWKPVAKGETSPDKQFTIKGVFYYVPSSENEEYIATSYEVLDVRWPNKTGRAEYGWALRKTGSEEIVAVVCQANGWWWRFKLKFVQETFYSRFNSKKAGFSKTSARTHSTQLCLGFWTRTSYRLRFMPISGFFIVKMFCIRSDFIIL